jgi:acetylornithine/succinyldiaminopimelate/putrescine aminotransferase
MSRNRAQRDAQNRANDLAAQRLAMEQQERDRLARERERQEAIMRAEAERTARDNDVRSRITGRGMMIGRLVATNTGFGF